MNEAQLMRRIQVLASTCGCRLFRNNVGLFMTIDGRWIHTGLCPGSSDLIGWDTDGKFLAVEVKASKGVISSDQLSFLEAANKAGGTAGVARSLDDFLKIIGK